MIHNWRCVCPLCVPRHLRRKKRPMTEQVPEHTDDCLRSDFPLLDFFEYGHLAVHLQAASAPFHDLAWKLAREHATRPQPKEDSPEFARLVGRRRGAETTVAIRKLLEAKDAAVRAQL